ncbi:hypothetical protein, partial [Stenotrophomonas lactitubi]|uniref:hypothetical protein n=1 Tax=Stenotrophomonas lactitubi TaxID=2045214 RepID=UPI003340E1C5
PSHRSGRCCRCCFVVGPEGLSSLRAAYYAGLFESVNTFVRSSRPSVVASLFALVASEEVAALQQGSEF